MILLSLEISKLVYDREYHEAPQRSLNNLKFTKINLKNDVSSVYIFIIHQNFSVLPEEELLFELRQGKCRQAKLGLLRVYPPLVGLLPVWNTVWHQSCKLIRPDWSTYDRVWHVKRQVARNCGKASVECRHTSKCL